MIFFLLILSLFSLSFRYAYEKVWDGEVYVYAGNRKIEDLVKNSASVWDSLSGLSVKYGGIKRVEYRIGQNCQVEVLTPFEGILVVKEDGNPCGKISNATTYRLDKKSFIIVIYREKGNPIYDYSVLIHEMGHALGLDHPFERGEKDTYSVMNYYPYVSAFPTADDVQVLRKLYGDRKKKENPVNMFYPAEGILCIGGSQLPFSLSSCKAEPYGRSVQCFKVLEGNCKVLNKNNSLKEYSGFGIKKDIALWPSRTANGRCIWW